MVEEWDEQATPRSAGPSRPWTAEEGASRPCAADIFDHLEQDSKSAEPDILVLDPEPPVVEEEHGEEALVPELPTPARLPAPIPPDPVAETEGVPELEPVQPAPVPLAPPPPPAEVPEQHPAQIELPFSVPPPPPRIKKVDVQPTPAEPPASMTPAEVLEKVGVPEVQPSPQTEAPPEAEPERKAPEEPRRAGLRFSAQSMRNRLASGAAKAPARPLRSSAFEVVQESNQGEGNAAALPPPPPKSVIQVAVDGSDLPPPPPAAPPPARPIGTPTKLASGALVPSPGGSNADLDRLEEELQNIHVQSPASHSIGSLAPAFKEEVEEDTSPTARALRGLGELSLEEGPLVDDLAQIDVPKGNLVTPSAQERLQAEWHARLSANPQAPLGVGSLRPRPGNTLRTAAKAGAGFRPAAPPPKAQETADEGFGFRRKKTAATVAANTGLTGASAAAPKGPGAGPFPKQSAMGRPSGQPPAWAFHAP